MSQPTSRLSQPVVTTEAVVVPTSVVAPSSPLAPTTAAAQSPTAIAPTTTTTTTTTTTSTVVASSVVPIPPTAATTALIKTTSSTTTTSTTTTTTAQPPAAQPPLTTAQSNPTTTSNQIESSSSSSTILFSTNNTGVNHTFADNNTNQDSAVNYGLIIALVIICVIGVSVLGWLLKKWLLPTSEGFKARRMKGIMDHQLDTPHSGPGHHPAHDLELGPFLNDLPPEKVVTLARTKSLVSRNNSMLLNSLNGGGVSRNNSVNQPFSDDFLIAGGVAGGSGISSASTLAGGSAHSSPHAAYDPNQPFFVDPSTPPGYPAGIPHYDPSTGMYYIANPNMTPAQYQQYYHQYQAQYYTHFHHAPPVAPNGDVMYPTMPHARHNTAPILEEPQVAPFAQTESNTAEGSPLLHNKRNSC
ncbi:hypothetical protein BCR33DRAFT_735133 [Rhizoclosmatium globosum]|uniref:Uncharacterized protein n=1 Tax=Rhizoclosmatium globosum TaxID=329046 RepID=A0A1Y2CPJ8_9FUNG|nr:hypothetical protein BCR33DRAFT_735133 [Rhizoclosmatium globosum]|eukprot:ORY48932.1 hypothetical protein BCR33DRAFT_735133 [Rhizoclosmatium globosum]